VKSGSRIAVFDDDGSCGGGIGPWTGGCVGGAEVAGTE